MIVDVILEHRYISLMLLLVVSTVMLILLRKFADHVNNEFEVQSQDDKRLGGLK